MVIFSFLDYVYTYMYMYLLQLLDDRAIMPCFKGRKQKKITYPSFFIKKNPQINEDTIILKT